MAIQISEDRKKLIIQAIVVLVCLGFMLESFAFGNRGGEQQGPGQNTGVYSGIAELNMTVVDYRPYLYVDGGLNASAKAIVAGTAGVDEIIEDGDRAVISISGGADAHGIYAKLRREGINTYTLTSVSTPPYFEITLLNGSTHGVAGTRFDYMMEPVSEIGGKVRMRMVVQVSGDRIAGIGNIVPMLEPVELEFNATILESSGRMFRYSVPWEGRVLDMGNLTAEFGEGNVEYARNDNVFLEAALAPQEMIAKKYDYVETISEMSISVGPGFADRARVELDFGDAVFPASTLTIRAEEEPGLGFDYVEKSSYVIAVPEKIDDYYLFVDEYRIEHKAGEEGEILVIMNASALGGSVMEIGGITVLD